MGTLEHTIAVPVWTLVIGVVAWLGTNIMIWIATGRRATSILAGAKKESIAQKDEVVAHFDGKFSELGGNGQEAGLGAEIAAVKAHIKDIDEALGSRFTELEKSLPATVAQALGSQKGVAMKALYAEGDEAAEEVENYAVDTLDPMEVAAIKLQGMNVSDDYREKNALGAGIIDIAKEMALGWLGERRTPGTVTMKRVGSGKSGYG